MVATDINNIARQAAGNWLKFDPFCWHTRPDDAEQWCLIYTSNRDSGLLDQSNAAAIEKMLEPFEDDVISQRHNHWAVGYVDGYAIRVFGQDGKVTDAFAKWQEILESLENYPILDDEDHSEREYEATLQNIKEAGRQFVTDDAPEDWAYQVLTWFDENDQRAVECRDDQGGYPTDQQMKDALHDLGWLDDEYIPEEVARCKVCGRIVKCDDDGRAIGHSAFPAEDIEFATYNDESCLGSGMKCIIDY